MKTFRLGIVGLVFVCLVSAAGAQDITTFNVPNAIFFDPIGINLEGETAGNYYVTDYINRGFLRYPNGKIVTFDAPGAGSDRNHGTEVTGLNAAGQIVGFYNDVKMAVLYSHGFVREPNGTFIVFDAAPGAIYTTPQVIDLDGRIAGFYADATYSSHGFVRDPDGKITTFDVPNIIWSIIGLKGRGQITGAYLAQNGAMRGFVDHLDGALTSFDAPGSSSGTGGIGCGHCFGTLPLATNLEGQIVGYYGGANAVVYGFLRERDETILSIQVSGSSYTAATAIDLEGQIAGNYTDAERVWHSFKRDKNGTIDSFDVPGSVYTYITGINPSGEMSGYYQDANGTFHGFVLTFKDGRKSDHGDEDKRDDEDHRGRFE